MWMFVREMVGLYNGLPGGARPLVALEVFRDSVFGPVGRAFLATFLDNFHGVDGFIRVGELLEKLATFWILDGFRPFAEVAVYELLHLLLEISTDAQLVIQNHFSQVIDSAW